MSPEKVAILVVAGLIAVLLAVALLGTESQGSPSPGPSEKPKAGAERIRPTPKQIEEYTFEDIVKGSARPRPPVKPVAEPPKETTTQYVVKKDDTIEKIARRELGNRSYVGRILALNKGLNPTKLRIGTKIALPVVRQDARSVTAEAPRKRATAPIRGKKETASAGSAAKSL
jgi:nucleoid-associated protein YgaU